MMCMEARQSLGVFVIGSLPMHEAVEVREHLGICPECRVEYDELAGLPALLNMITEVEATFGPVQANDAMLDRLLAQVAAERRRDRGRHRILAAVAAIVLVIGVGAAFTMLPGLNGQQGSTPVQLAATNQETGLRAEMLYGHNEKGTWTNLRLSDVRPGTRCKLIVVARNGKRYEASDWQSSETGTAQVRTDLPMRPEAIARFEIVDQNKKPLVVLPL